MRVEFFKHNIGEEEITEVTRVLRSAFLTTGETVALFEKKFSSYLGARHTVGVTSCTAALHLSLLAHGIGPGDEVVTTPLSFIATANATLHVGARPVFVDVESDTGNLDARLLLGAITSQTRAVIPVHLYGLMCDMKTIKTVADKKKIVVIEDSAHCIEGEREGILPGQISDAACFSFYATKNMTCGEGGAVVTNSRHIAEKIRTLRLHGMTANALDRYIKKYQHWDMETLGWKYNMSNIQAALLLHQIELLDERWKRREEIARRYEEAFSGVEGIQFPRVPASAKSARHLFTIWVNPKTRDRILWALQKQGIGIAVNFRPIHLMKYYRERFHYRKGMYPVAEKIGAQTLTLPLFPKLAEGEVEFVIQNVLAAVKKAV